MGSIYFLVSLPLHPTGLRGWVPGGWKRSKNGSVTLFWLLKPSPDAGINDEACSKKNRLFGGSGALTLRLYQFVRLGGETGTEDGGEKVNV